MEGDCYFGVIIVGSDVDNLSNLGMILVDLVCGENDVILVVILFGCVVLGDIVFYVVIIKLNLINENCDY